MTLPKTFSEKGIENFATVMMVVIPEVINPALTAY
jgi:hypothetical protein